MVVLYNGCTNQTINREPHHFYWLYISELYKRWCCIKETLELVVETRSFQGKHKCDLLSLRSAVCEMIVESFMLPLILFSRSEFAFQVDLRQHGRNASSDVIRVLYGLVFGSTVCLWSAKCCWCGGFWQRTQFIFSPLKSRDLNIFPRWLYYRVMLFSPSFNRSIDSYRQVPATGVMALTIW